MAVAKSILHVTMSTFCEQHDAIICVPIAVLWCHDTTCALLNEPWTREWPCQEILCHRRSPPLALQVPAQSGLSSPGLKFRAHVCSARWAARQPHAPAPPGAAASVLIILYTRTGVSRERAVTNGARYPSSLTRWHALSMPISAAGTLRKPGVVQGLF